MTFVGRAVFQSFKAVAMREGLGTLINRTIGTRHQRQFSPFLLFDHFIAEKGTGFQDHPHRGQETITYMLQGYVDHEDFTGGHGTIGPGDLQFMTAGRGIYHAEIPRSDNASPAVGLQFWIDLPKQLKYTEPRYRDLRAAEIPTVDQDRFSVKVISGRSFGVTSDKELSYTPVWLLHFYAQPGAHIKQELPADFSGFVYGLRGAVEVSNAALLKPMEIALLEQEGSGVELCVPANAGPTEFIVAAGQVLDQPVFRKGTITVTTKEEIGVALDDLAHHKNGFERAAHWRSKIAPRKTLA